MSLAGLNLVATGCFVGAGLQLTGKLFCAWLSMKKNCVLFLGSGKILCCVSRDSIGRVDWLHYLVSRKVAGSHCRAGALVLCAIVTDGCLSEKD